MVAIKKSQKQNQGVDKRLVFGVVIPLIIFLVLTFLSTSGIGLKVETTTADVINLSDSHPLQVIFLTNDFFIPRKYELPPLIACFYDYEDSFRSRQVSLRYSHTDTVESRRSLDSLLFLDYPFRQKKSVELPSNSQTQIVVYIPADSYYKNLFSDYDEILLFESEQKKYYPYGFCRNLVQDEIDSAKHIKIVH